jgi:hypothetical protein
MIFRKTILLKTHSKLEVTRILCSSSTNLLSGMNVITSDFNDLIEVQAFVLNFNGRVDKASVKNFQLIDEYDDNKIYMQFGRVGKH